MDTLPQSTDEIPEYELIDVPEACKLLGGSRPINPATFYRGVASGLYPKPIKIGNSARLLKCEIIAIIKARIAARDAATDRQVA